MVSLGWLHLTDLHMGMAGQSALWPTVRELFLKDLQTLHNHSGPWDVVFFSGDLTQRADSLEFTKVLDLLHELLQHLRRMGSDPVFLPVPGNHDLTRPTNPNQPEALLLQRWGEEPSVRQRFFEDSSCSYRQVVSRAFANYTAWSQRLTAFRQPANLQGGILPGDFSATIEKQGARLGILGLNSSFLQLTSGNYKGKLALTAEQFHGACQNDGPKWAQSHHLCFLLTHHPPDWLSSLSQQTLSSEINPPGRFALHLFGHLHEGSTSSVATNGGTARRLWQGSSLFSQEGWSGKRKSHVRQHGYAAGRVELNRDSGTLRLWPRSGRHRPDGSYRIVADLHSFDLKEEDMGTAPEPFHLLSPLSSQPAAAGLESLGSEMASLTPSSLKSLISGQHFRPVRIFTSYVQKDIGYYRSLEDHLAQMRRVGLIETWDARQVLAGSDWQLEIHNQLEAADIILLLVSADFLASEYCNGVEVRRALELQDAGRARVVPIIIRPTDLVFTPFARLQALPRNAVPVSSWTSHDDAWVDVVRGLRNVVRNLSARDNQLSFSPPSSPIAGGERRVRPSKNIEDIFRSPGLPEDTYVEPAQFPRLKRYLRTMGKGLVVEGPSGIGKTTAIQKALESLPPGTPVHLLSSRFGQHLNTLDRLLEHGFTGHLVIDDFHAFDDIRKGRIAEQMKYLADTNRRDAKITVIGINTAGYSLVQGHLPDLADRFDSLPMGQQLDPQIELMIKQGERAANILFLRRAEIIETAYGSFATAQKICLAAATRAGILNTQAKTVIVNEGPFDVLDEVQRAFFLKFNTPLHAFVSFDAGATPIPRGACLVLLWLLKQERQTYVLIAQARTEYPQFGRAFDWLEKGHLAKCIKRTPHLSHYLYYDPRNRVLAIEDPHLWFYLRHLTWVGFARRAGLSISISSDERLHFL